MNVRTTLALTTIMAITLATGCTRHISRDISDQGAAGEVVFPATDRLVLKEGTFPTLEALTQIGPGITKDQLYALLGRPHFREGFRAREWDYLFHFRNGNQITTCQFKVLFDGDYQGQSFHWSPETCRRPAAAAPAAAVPTSTTPVAPTRGAPVAQERRFELSGDALFAFGRHGTADIMKRGRGELDAIALQLMAANPASIRIVGHTDYIGDALGNQTLSQRRADTVRAYLAAKGVRAEAMSAVGLGEGQPTKQCAANQPRAALIECLQPNRRVEIFAGGMR